MIRFPKGLNEKFTQSKTQIMMMNPLPRIDQAFALIIQQELELNSSQSTICNNTRTDESITLHLNAASGPNYPKSGNNSFKGTSNVYGGNKGHNRVCTHCGRTNHTIETCFLKHGYPAGFKGKGKTPTSNVQSQSVASVETGHASSEQLSTQFTFGFT